MLKIAMRRAGTDAEQTEVAELRAKIARLERDLRRAKRCLAAERMGRENLRVRFDELERAYSFAVGTLCKLLPPVAP